MTAPDMVSVIAEVLWNTDRTTHVPWKTLAEDDEDKGCYLEDARAVLAAISEAGEVQVQFGLDFGDEVSQQDTLEDVHDERDTILGWIGDDEVQASDYGPLAPVTRTILTHVGPWERAE